MALKTNIIENDYMTYVVENAEKEIYRINYEQELKWIDSIRSGRYERAGQNVSDMNPDKVGKLASSSFKQLEYLCVCEITLATRAAIEGGISPLEAAHLLGFVLDTGSYKGYIDTVK